MASFRGTRFFLSNFYPCSVVLDGQSYASSEHAYASLKCLQTDDQLAVRSAATAGAAKRLAKHCEHKPNWNEERLSLMLVILRAKFSLPALRDALIATGDGMLVEENEWYDTFWGVCRGVGENNLGKLLMQVRTELREAHG